MSHLDYGIFDCDTHCYEPRDAFTRFLPTDYRGVSELGQIAGMGMLVAYLTSITLLPALLKVLNPKGEPEPLGFAFLGPVDKFMEDHRVAIIVGVAIVSLGGLPLLYYLQFDFNPINLRNPKVESIATFLDLRKDPITGANAISVLAPNLEAVKPIEERLSKLPEVSQVRTLNFFVPADQDKKLAAIAKARDEIEPSFKPDAAQEPPTDADNVTALNEAVTNLKEAAEKHPGQGAAAAKRLSDLLGKLAGRCKDEGPGGASRPRQQGVQHRQQERGGLAGAGLGDGDEVAAAQDGRDCLFLNRCGSDVTEGLGVSREKGRKAELLKRH